MSARHLAAAAGAAVALTACGQHDGVHREPALPMPRATVEPTEPASVRADRLRDEAVSILARQPAVPSQADLDLVDALLEQAAALDLEVSP